MPSCLASIPLEDPAVYDMICAADTVGVFQIESRAQMTMLPRLRPRCYYDLVIEVAIVRPGPIQGDMVHPYLRRRNGEEPIHYPTPEVKRVLGRTLGVPLFQEQAMSLAIVAAGFTAGEADQLRRAMAAWKRKGNLLENFRQRFINGMLERGYQPDFAERCFNQLKGFSEYGFPESHAASFAHLVYASAWLKKHHPAAFAAALINSQPMGFYAPAQIIRDAQQHGVTVLPVDVNHSHYDCTLEPPEVELNNERQSTTNNTNDHQQQTTNDQQPPTPAPAIRLGLRLVKGLREAHGRAIERAVQKHGRFDTVESLRLASGITAATLRTLAHADAFRSMSLDRRRARWRIMAIDDGEPLPLFRGLEPVNAETDGRALPELPPIEHVRDDYDAVGLSLKAHPMSFLREKLAARGVMPAAELADAARAPAGRRVEVAGIVLIRQRPATASGIIFITLEDETGIANLIIRPPIYERYRKAARHGVILRARGRIERQGIVVHVVVDSLATLDAHPDAPVKRNKSRDFH